MAYSEGDLVECCSGKWRGKMGIVVKGTYTHRFMDSPTDWEMEAHGMGHLAGSYGSAVDVVFTDTGQRRRIEQKHVRPPGGLG